MTVENVVFPFLRCIIPSHVLFSVFPVLGIFSLCLEVNVGCVLRTSLVMPLQATASRVVRKKTTRKSAFGHKGSVSLNNAVSTHSLLSVTNAKTRQAHEAEQKAAAREKMEKDIRRIHELEELEIECETEKCYVSLQYL